MTPTASTNGGIVVVIERKNEFSYPYPVVPGENVNRLTPIELLSVIYFVFSSTLVVRDVLVAKYWFSKQNSSSR